MFIETMSKYVLKMVQKKKKTIFYFPNKWEGPLNGRTISKFKSHGN